MTQTKTLNVFSAYVEENSLSDLKDVLDSGWIGLGPKTKEFEKKFADYTGASFGIATNSCTSALHLALDAIEIGPGDVVISTPMTFVSTNLVIKYCGANILYADVDNNGNISPESIKELINTYNNIKAIMVVHFAGYPADLDSIKEAIGNRDIKIIEDCAHAAGAEYKGKKVGGSNTFISCFSFQAVKNLPVGDGGMLTTNNETVAQRAAKAAWCGINKSTFSRSQDGKAYTWEYDVPVMGYKYHMNDISATIGINQLPRLDEYNSRRREIAKYYKENINPKIMTFAEYSDENLTASHFLPGYSNSRNDLMLYLAKRGINCGVHYNLNTRYKSTQPMVNTNISNAEHIEARTMTLPMHLRLNDSDLRYIADSVNSYES